MRSYRLAKFALITLVTLVARAVGQTTAPAPRAAFFQLDSANWQRWTGLTPAGETAFATLPAAMTYRVPDGPLGPHRVGLGESDDGVLDVRRWYGLRFDIELPGEDRPIALDLTLSTRPAPSGRVNTPTSTSAKVQVAGKGWRTITVPIESFDYKRGQQLFLSRVKQIDLRASASDTAAATLRLRNVRLVRANAIAVDAPIKSKPGDGGAAVSYTVSLTNCTDAPQLLALGIVHRGWEGMAAEVLPATIMLAPGASGSAVISVQVPADLPPGGREEQTLVVAPQDGSSEAVTTRFITLRRLTYPYLTHDANGWNDVRAKIANYPWAKDDAAQMIAAADAFTVPTVPPGGIMSDQGTLAVYKSYIEQKLYSVSVAYAITGDKKYAEKLALFLRQFADPANGYPVTHHAVTQGIPQEGGFFEGIAIAYDLIHDAGVLSDSDKELIEQSFREYIAWNLDGAANGGISNWSLFNLCPASMCALAIQDLDLFDRLMNDTGGIVDHMRYGIMNDGWWYEMSLSYNLGCAEVLTKAGIAAQAFGIDLLHLQIPAAMTRNVGLREFEYSHFEGMAFGKFGPLSKTTVTLKQMWDGITPFPDYRGVMFGMGDGHEQTVAGGPFELAYYAFRDPAYAAVIARGTTRDLVFGVPDLPAKLPELDKITAKADNAGIAVLRSQTPGREQREQIQAAFKYGTHGGYHGHFDRLSLDSLMRYGRSFFNPETSWFGYGSYMYKWWVQVSLAHNMVVVDDKMQEPQECRLLLFHSGPMLQAIAAETTARWSNPPYLGGYDQIDKIKSGDLPFVPIPDNHPGLGEITGYTEPVRQRRLVLVTDDYVVLADDLKADKSHTFDNLLHLRGAAVPDQANVSLAGHLAQLDPDPLGSGQFITNCARYNVTAPATVESVHRIGGSTRVTDSFNGDSSGKNWETGGAKSLSEPGELHIDARVLWPPKSEIIIGQYAESWSVNKKLTYGVIGDGRTLAAGTFGAWKLGSAAIDVDVTGLQSLQLTTQADRPGNTLNTLFWGDARLVLADGREIAVKDLAAANGVARVTSENIIAAHSPTTDYAGGSICIAGNPVAAAIAAEPVKTEQPGVVTINLAGLNAVRFKALIGGDWPVGDDEQVRKTVAIRSAGSSARFLTVLEPFEKSRAIRNATATSPDTLRVELLDGRVQDITITGLDTASGDVQATITEQQGDHGTRREFATGTAPTATEK